jgi:hypothetical protein
MQVDSTSSYAFALQRILLFTSLVVSVWSEFYFDLPTNSPFIDAVTLA